MDKKTLRKLNISTGNWKCGFISFLFIFDCFNCQRIRYLHSSWFLLTLISTWGTCKFSFKSVVCQSNLKRKIGMKIVKLCYTSKMLKVMPTSSLILTHLRRSKFTFVKFESFYDSSRELSWKSEQNLIGKTTVLINRTSAIGW